jgi:mannitol-1-phosphate/altronate dehydrogenase
MKKIIYKIKPPCRKCPYKQGKVSIAIIPCRNCKENGYNMYERLVKTEQERAKPQGGKND